MGWNLCIASEKARQIALQIDHLDADAAYALGEKRDQHIVDLSRHFSYNLLREGGLLYSWLSESDLATLEPDDLENPASWRARNPSSILDILARVHDRLRRENAALPVTHYLWCVDASGKRTGGHSSLTLPPGPHKKRPKQIRLYGNHTDPQHRNDLKTCTIRIDPDHLKSLRTAIRREHPFLYLLSRFTPLDVTITHTPSVEDPEVEEHSGWIPAEPVLNIMGYRVEVSSEDVFSRLGPDLEIVVARCAQSRDNGQPMYWLRA